LNGTPEFIAINAERGVSGLVTDYLVRGNATASLNVCESGVESLTNLFPKDRIVWLKDERTSTF
jgi:hypothetical protein